MKKVKRLNAQRKCERCADELRDLLMSMDEKRLAFVYNRYIKESGINESYQVHSRNEFCEFMVNGFLASPNQFRDMIWNGIYNGADNWFIVESNRIETISNLSEYLTDEILDMSIELTTDFMSGISVKWLRLFPELLSVLEKHYKKEVA